MESDEASASLQRASKSKRKQAIATTNPGKRQRRLQQAEQLQAAAQHSTAESILSIIGLTYNIPWRDVYALILIMGKDQAAIAYKQLKQDERYWMKRLKNEYRDYWNLVKQFPLYLKQVQDPSYLTTGSSLFASPNASDSFLLYQKARKRDRWIAHGKFRRTEAVERLDLVVENAWTINRQREGQCRIVLHDNTVEGIAFVNVESSFDLQFNEATLPEGYQQVQEDAEKVYNFPNGIVLVVQRDEEISVLCRPIEIQTFYGPNFGRWLMYNDNSAFPDRPTLLEAWERFYAWTRAVSPFIGIPEFVHEVNTEHGLPLFLTARSVVDFFHQIWSKVPRPEPRYLLELPADVDVARGITVVPDGIIYRPLGKAHARILMFQTGKNLLIPDWVQGDTDYKYHRVLDIGAPFEPVVIIRGLAHDTDMFLTNANLKPEFLYQIHSFSNGWLCYRHMDGTSWIVHLRRKAEGLWSECAIAGNFFFVDADTVVEMDRLLVDDILMTDFYPPQLYAGENFQLIQQTCAHCTEPARQLCSKCDVAYCSTACQRSDWSQHRSVCKLLEIK